MNFRPITPREKVLRCVTLQLNTTCQKRKARIEVIKENIISRENEKINKYHYLKKTKEMYQQRYEINKLFFKI